MPEPRPAGFAVPRGCVPTAERRREPSTPRARRPGRGRRPIGSPRLLRPRLRDERVERLAQRFTRGTRAPPAEAVDLVDLQADDGYVSPPTAATAGELILDGVRSEPDGFGCQVGDFRDGDLVAGRDVVDVVVAGALAVREQHGSDDVLHMDVRLALRAVAEDAQPARVREKRAREVEADAVGLARADDVAEPKRAAGEAEHRAIRRDES